MLNSVKEFRLAHVVVKALFRYALSFTQRCVWHFVCVCVCLSLSLSVSVSPFLSLSLPLCPFLCLLWLSSSVHDVQAAREFYGGVLGLEVRQHMPFPLLFLSFPFFSFLFVLCLRD